MPLTSEDIVPITAARARLTELADAVFASGEPKLLTRNGESYVALITAAQLDELERYRQAEAVSVLNATAEALEDVSGGRAMTWEAFKPQLVALRERLRGAAVTGAVAAVAEPAAAYRVGTVPQTRKSIPRKTSAGGKQSAR